MAAFVDVSQFATEFSIRTLLNYYQICLLNVSTQDERRSLEERIDNLHAVMRDKQYTVLDHCWGTQLINSVLGLLVFPYEQNKNCISNYTEQSKWSVDFPVLSRYIFCNDPTVFKSTYMYEDKKTGIYKLQQKSPRYILKHMRNAVGHKNVRMYPVQERNANGGVEQVTHIVFEDKNDDASFKLVVEMRDFEDVMFEISRHLICLDTIIDRNKIQKWNQLGEWDRNQRWAWSWYA